MKPRTSAVARKNRSMASVIEESPEPRSIQACDATMEIVAKAQTSSGLTDDEAMTPAIEETGRYRERR